MAYDEEGRRLLALHSDVFVRDAVHQRHLYAQLLQRRRVQAPEQRHLDVCI